jgi:hypothetical protein
VEGLSCLHHIHIANSQREAALSIACAQKLDSSCPPCMLIGEPCSPPDTIPYKYSRLPLLSWTISLPGSLRLLSTRFDTSLVQLFFSFSFSFFLFSYPHYNSWTHFSSLSSLSHSPNYITTLNQRVYGLTSSPLFFSRLFCL